MLDEFDSLRERAYALSVPTDGDEAPAAWVPSRVLQVLVDGLVRVRVKVRVRVSNPNPDANPNANP